MARETTSEPSGTTRPDPGKKGVEKTSREVNQYLKKKYGNQEAIKEAYEADPKRFMGDIDSFVGERGGWQHPDLLSPYLDPNDPQLAGDPPPDPRANLVPLNPLGDPKHRMSPPETTGELQTQSNIRLSHPDDKKLSDWPWPGTAEDAILYVYGRPTKDNTKWFDNVWWKGASDLVMRAINEMRGDDLLKIANQMGWPAFDAVTRLHMMNNPQPDEQNVKGFNVPGKEKIRGFNVPDNKKIKGFNVPSNDKIPGFNVPYKGDDDDIRDTGEPRSDKVPGFNEPDK